MRRALARVRTATATKRTRYRPLNRLSCCVVMHSLSPPNTAHKLQAGGFEPAPACQLHALVRRPARSSARSLPSHLRIAMTMNDAPAVQLAAKDHRNAKLKQRLLGSPGDLEANLLELHQVPKVAVNIRRNPLGRAGPFRELRARPVQSWAHLVPTMLATAKAAKDCDIGRARPEILECLRTALDVLGVGLCDLVEKGREFRALCC